MYNVHNYFLSQIRNSNKMQNFFFVMKIFKLTAFANFDVCSNFFVHVFSIISINNSTKRFFSFSMFVVVVHMFNDFISFFRSSTIFNKNTFLMFRRKNWRFCTLKLKFFFSVSKFRNDHFKRFFKISQILNDYFEFFEIIFIQNI